jgi:AraC-like DNA-binding protein
MTPTQVKRVLKQNKKAGRRPWSLYQLAQMRGCSRSLVTQAMQDPTKSRPFFVWVETVLGEADCAAVAADGNGAAS